jgi:hypothetical protein
MRQERIPKSRRTVNRGNPYPVVPASDSDRYRSESSRRLIQKSNELLSRMGRLVDSCTDLEPMTAAAGDPNHREEDFEQAELQALEDLGRAAMEQVDSLKEAVVEA